MRRTLRGGALVLVGQLLCVAIASGEELRNDGFESGQAANFQGGFIDNEIGAVRLVPTVTCPCPVNDVTLLFGPPSPFALPIVLHIWDDAAGTLDPGPLIYIDSFSLTGSDTELQVIDLSSEGIVVQGPIRVGIEVFHVGLPAIASDTDATILEDHNFIFADLFPLPFAWFESADLGVTGDWIIRANVPEPAAPLGLGACVACIYGMERLRRRSTSMHRTDPGRTWAATIRCAGRV